MFRNSSQGADALNFQPAGDLPEYGTGRHLLFGDLRTVQAMIKCLHRLNYAEPNDWSKPVPTGRSNEVMVILTKRVRVD